MIQDIDQPLDKDEKFVLVNLLRNNRHDSIWGDAIRKVFRDNGDVDALIQGLAEQGMDDIFTMVCILGKDLTRLILRAYK